MGLEQNDGPQTAPSTPAPGILNFLNIKAAHHDSSVAATSTKQNEVFPDLPVHEPNVGGQKAAPDRLQTSARSNFAGLPELKRESSTLDLSAPIYPNDKGGVKSNKAASFSAPADSHSGTKVLDLNAALPQNRYEIAVKEQVSQLASEAAFTPFTQAALNRDSDRFPAVRNENDHTTTYTIEQIGITDRNLQPGDTNAEHYKRLVNITVPDSATSLKECKFTYKDRQTIDVKEFNALVDHSQKRQSELTASSAVNARMTAPDDMTFYTHGIRTGAEDADFMALALQLTNGHSVINVDWKSTAVRDETYGLNEAYDINRRGAAESYPKFEKALDQAISHIGAEHTDMIAFSHGATFDTKYLQHRKQISAPSIDEVVFAHPDVKCSIMAPVDATGKVANGEQLYASVSRSSYVIGTSSDLALGAAEWNDCESAPKGSKWGDSITFHNKQMEIHARLGNGTRISRNLVTGHGGTYVAETIPKDKKDALNHFVNMGKINSLINKAAAETKLSSLETRN